jgi:hypothetical protein
VRWVTVKGPREFDHLRGFDMDVGWAYDIARDTDRRTVSVIVAGGRLRSNDLPMESQRAIETKGRSAVEAVLEQDEPPRYLIISSGGVRPREEG